MYRMVPSTHSFGSRPKRIPVRVRIGNVMRARDKSPEPFPLNFSPHEGQDPHRAAVKAPREADHLLTPRGPSRKLDGGFRRLATRPAEKNLLRRGSPDEREDFFLQFNPGPRAERHRLMHFPGLIPNRLDNLGMTVPGVERAEPGHKIEKNVAVHILDLGPERPLDNDGLRTHAEGEPRPRFGTCESGPNAPESGDRDGAREGEALLS